MPKSKYSKVLTIVLIVVVILIIGLLIFWGVSALTKNTIKTDAADALETFRNQISSNHNLNNSINNNASNQTDDLPIVNPYGNSIYTEENLIGDSEYSGGGSTSEHQYKGFNMLGYIEIPKTKVKYPILEETSKKALETSVAMLYGVGLNKVGNTVIVGHNYRNGTFFSDNGKLTIGDSIFITDNSGSTVEYTIYKKYQTTPEDADYATRDTEGNREITLSTCTDDSGARIVIWARAK